MIDTKRIMKETDRVMIETESINNRNPKKLDRNRKN